MQDDCKISTRNHLVVKDACKPTMLSRNRSRTYRACLHLADRSKHSSRAIECTNDAYNIDRQRFASLMCTSIFWRQMWLLIHR